MATKIEKLQAEARKADKAVEAAEAALERARIDAANGKDVDFGKLENRLAVAKAGAREAYRKYAPAAAEARRERCEAEQGRIEEEKQEQARRRRTIEQYRAEIQELEREIDQRKNDIANAQKSLDLMDRLDGPIGVLRAEVDQIEDVIREDPTIGIDLGDLREKLRPFENYQVESKFGVVACRAVLVGVLYNVQTGAVIEIHALHTRTNVRTAGVIGISALAAQFRSPVGISQVKRGAAQRLGLAPELQEVAS